MAIVTLSTDIGQQDYIVGAFKGQLLSKKQDLIIVDICHYLSQSNFPEAAYICGNAFKHFPPQTIHIVIVNFFEKNVEDLLIAEFNNQIIICADNGILTMITDAEPVVVYKLSYNCLNTFLQITQQISEVVAAIANGNKISDIGIITNLFVVKNPLRITVAENFIKGHIIFIDNFENVVINISKQVFETHRKGRKFIVIFKRNEKVEGLSNGYLSVKDGDNLAWFNSAGYLELAVNKGNMAGLFGLQEFNELNYKEGKSMQNKLFYSTAVTILFQD